MNRFFDYFGTHFFTAASTGGVFRMQYQSDLYLLYAMNERDIAEQAQFSFFNFLILSGAISDSKKTIDANFSAMTTIMEQCKGGSFCPSSPSDYDQWQISVASTPWIMAASFEPMYVLLYDEVLIQESFKRAIRNRLQRAYLKEEVLGHIEMIKQKVKHAINITSTFNESVQCEYPQYTEGDVATKHCNGSDINCCNGTDGFKHRYLPRHEFSDHVINGDLGAFYFKLAAFQESMMEQILMVENHSSLLLEASVIVEDEVMFNETAKVWEKVVATVQSKPQWENCRWINEENCSHLKANKHHTCHLGPCNNDKFGKCHDPVTVNMTYFGGLIA